jgi:hypothetical protein
MISQIFFENFFNTRTFFATFKDLIFGTLLLGLILTQKNIYKGEVSP